MYNMTYRGIHMTIRLAHLEDLKIISCVLLRMAQARMKQAHMTHGKTTTPESEIHFPQK